jgi:protocatechuate 3,4-dioxygenase beta subunit
MTVILLTCATAADVGCDGGAGRSVGATTSPAAVISTPATTSALPIAACPAPAFDPVDARSVLIPGPIKAMPRSDAGGEKLVIAGVVLDPACLPASDARLRVWHTDALGLYGPPGTDICCYYGGIVRSDSNGRFRLDTIRPAQYPEPGAPPAHIHLEINHSSGRLMAQIIFSDSDLRLPASGLIPVTLHKIDKHWYGEAVLRLER